MTVPRWDAKKWHNDWRHRRSPAIAGAPPTAQSSKGRKGALALIATATLLVMAAAVNATQPGTPGDPEKIAVCHATGSESNPWVFLLVKKDGYEHAFLRAHPYDFFPEDPSRGCQGDEIPTAPAAEPAGNATGNETDADDGSGDGNAPGGNATVPTPDGNATVPDNQTVPDNATDGNETVGNSTENATAPPPPPPGDVAARQSAWQDDFEVVLTIEVRSVGAGDATDVTLHDELPDLRRTWYLGGVNAPECTLSGRTLDCWLGDMAPGETKMVQLRGYTDRMPCGFSLTNTPLVGAFEDSEPRNNGSSASIAARAC